MSVKRPAPRFRARRIKPESPLRRWRWRILAAAAGVAALVAIGLVSWIIIDSGDDGTAQAGGGGPDVAVEGPAARYVVQLGELPAGFKEFPPDTFPVSRIGFASAQGYFTTSDEGERLADEWGYVDGYQASYLPVGQLADVVQGMFYLQTEAYLFNSIEGAQAAYTYLEQHHKAQAGSETQSAKGLGNESSAFKLKTGTVGTSDLPGVYHRFIFRRGTLISVVQTYGADKYMTIDQARAIAARLDAKALGTAPAYTPTPVPRTPQVPPAATPTAGP
jgi:hypothetical protein